MNECCLFNIYSYEGIHEARNFKNGLLIPILLKEIVSLQNASQQIMTIILPACGIFVQNIGLLD